MATSEAWNHEVRGKEEVTAFRSSTAETGGRKPTSIRWKVEAETACSLSATCRGLARAQGTAIFEASQDW